MNWLDYVLIAILLFSAFVSARKGFSREIIGLAAAFFALLLGMWFYGSVGSYLVPYTGSERIANLLGFLIVGAAVLIAGSLLSWMVNRLLRTVGLSFFDRLLGGLFGALRGLLIAVTVLTAFIAFGPYIDSKKASASVVDSKIAPFVLDASHIVVGMAPMELKSSFQQQYSSLKSAFLRDTPKDKAAIPARSQDKE